MTKKKDPEQVANSYKGLLKKNKVITSQKRELITADYRRWARNFAIFFAPALIIFLLQLQAGKTIEEALPVLYLWMINSLIDITRKFLTENTYKPLDEAGEIEKKGK